MRVTIHNARTGKNGTFSPRHNDRDFDMSHAEHIDSDKTNLNRYWNWTGNLEISFADAEKAFYEKYIQQHLNAQNDRYRAHRHAERTKTMDEYRTSPQTCPEEVILMIGKMGDTIPADMAARIIQEQLNWEQKTFPGVKILDVALHMDEKTVHVHERRVWTYTDKQGNLAIGQNKALEEMGIDLPNPNKPRSRYNNRKITFSQICRKHFMEICRENGLEIQEEVLDKSKRGLDLLEYKITQTEDRLKTLQADEKRLNFNIKSNNRKYQKVKNELLTAEKQLEGVQELLTKTEQRELFKIYQEREYERTR